MALINSKCNCLMPLHFKGLRQYVVIQICMWLSLSADLSLNLNFNQKTLHFSEVQFTTLDREFCSDAVYVQWMTLSFV